MRRRRVYRQIRRPGAYYVIPGHEDNPFSVYRITRTSVIVQGTTFPGFIEIPKSRMRPGGYGFDWWHYGDRHLI